MIGIVVVSHSRPLARAAVALAGEMVPPEARPKIAVAAGLDDETFGTDAQAIADAIQEVDSADGVVVLTDLGSAILSAEMALELIHPAVADHTQLAAAPLIEGLVAAVVTAGGGADLEAVVAEANAGLAAKLDHLGAPAPGFAGAAPAAAAPAEALTTEIEITNQHGLHARPAANLVAGLRGFDAQIQLSNKTTGKGPAPASSLAGVTTLGLRQGHVMAARVSGPEASVALAKLEALAAAGFGENEPGEPVAEATGEVTEQAQTGRQIAVGPAHHFSTEVDTSGYVAGDAATERGRLDQAIAAVSQRLHTQAQAPGEHGAVFAAQAILLEDPELATTLHAGLAEGGSAVAIVDRDFSALAAELASLDDPYLRERAQDIRSLARQSTAELAGVPFNLGPIEGLLLVDELDPLTANALDPNKCVGVVTCTGGATGHGVMIAGARGIPVVTGQLEAKGIPNGTVLGLDPVQGKMWVNPTMADLAELDRLGLERRNEATLASELSHQPSLTRSGQRILVEGNISSLTDAKLAAANGADGAGLVRTEVLFGEWDHAPSAEEQAAVFLKIAAALNQKMITIRTWDPGGDKPLAFLPQAPEANPLLGERGLRAMRRLPELFRTQLEAVALAARRTPVRVMFPMVTDVEEVRWAAGELRQVLAQTGGHVALGIMIETPAAAIRAGDFLPLVDFISIGTNDLIQYTMAADRGNGAVAHLVQGHKAAVWDLIEFAARAFAGRPVGVCGDLASQPEAAPRLVAAGVTELSVRPPLVGLVKLAVRTRA
jgi:phosphocarrier protein FPr